MVLKFMCWAQQGDDMYFINIHCSIPAASWHWLPVNGFKQKSQFISFLLLRCSLLICTWKQRMNFALCTFLKESDFHSNLIFSCAKSLPFATARVAVLFTRTIQQLYCMFVSLFNWSAL